MDEKANFKEQKKWHFVKTFENYTIKDGLCISADYLMNTRYLKNDTLLCKFAVNEHFRLIPDHAVIRKSSRCHQDKEAW